MPSKSLRKVEKAVTKKKGKRPALHQNSRDSHRLRRAGARDEKLFKHAAARSRLNQTYLERVTFFQQAMENNLTPITELEMQSLIEQYIQRSDGEIEALQADRRPGRPRSSRQDALDERRATEEKEYSSGFWVPDLRDSENLLKLGSWDRTWSSLNILKWCRLAQDGSLRDSKFPPTGE